MTEINVTPEMEMTTEVGLKYPRGTIKTAKIVFRGAETEKNFTAHIYLAGRLVEFWMTRAGDDEIETYHPFEGHDDYAYAGRMYAPYPVCCIADWRRVVTEQVTEMDPHDVFKNRRERRI